MSYRYAAALGAAFLFGFFASGAAPSETPAAPAGDNAAVIDALTRVALAQDDFADARKALITETIQTALARAPALDADKVARAEEDATVFFPSLLKGTKDLRDGQFLVVRDMLRWNLGNYARMRPITAETHQRARALFDGVVAAFPEVVEATYGALPPEQRKEIVDAAAEFLRPQRARVGSYFYPRVLYPVDNPPERRPDIVRDMTNASALQQAAKRLDADASNVKGEGEAAKNMRKMAVRREGAAVMSAAQIVLMAAFESLAAPDDKGFQPMPAQLRDAQQRLSQERMAESKARFEAAKPKRTPHAELMRELLKGTDLAAHDGLVTVPAEAVVP